ncbi:hypothetical protein Bacsa_2345 [Phocaeicola salanitronis DSM 18170]|uniref:DUF4988 domain-containing protein n=1 Tax=Phocaeicola salanitronis (strain DSM 18170 / JCM 13657 / CCUG 60908 / BL78) TaxID=667015 RepID=F0R6K5_PHOSB|nr:PL29 family lyase N-terminal domain-containing protein [Phocaeicola salanitronis]ADY36893.1 hypothetical protein Bacsa_2345 [Phocaeicola salanitronis DSM 18170]
MKMKHYLPAMALALAFAACSDDYDDSALWDAVNGNTQRIEALETWQEQVNSNIAALQQLLNTNDMITAVTPVTMGGETVGYTLSFLHSDPVTIYNGTQGEKGEAGDTPQIGLTQGEDGNWYWTLNGGLMSDAEGNPIRANGEDGEDGTDGDEGPAGADAPTPEIKLGNLLDSNATIKTDNGDKIEDAWYLSVDEGKTWYRVSGEDGDPMFSKAPEVDKDAGTVTFYLSATESFTVPLYQGITITFTSGGTTLDPNKPITVTGSTQEISYSVTGITSPKLSAIPSAEGWSATVSDKAITVTVETGAASECDLLVTATDNAGQSVSYTLSLRNGYSIDETTGDYIVSNAAGLLAWNEAAQSDYTLNCTLTADIDLTGKEWTPVGNSGQTYNGTFDGQGHTITGLNASSLFGGIGESATVKNLQLVDVKLNESGGATAGIVVNNYGTIMACSMTGEISAYSYTSGIANFNLGTIVACWFSGTLKENEGYGIVAFNYGTITACFWDGNTTNGYRSNEGGTVEATKVEGTITWQTAVDGMNAALTGNGYQWKLGENNLPVLKKNQ